MADIQRLILRVLVVLLGMMGSAQAVTTKPGNYSDGAWAYTECHTQIRAWANQYVGYQADTIQALAQRIQAAVGVGYVWTCNRTNGEVLTRTFNGVSNDTLNRLRFSFNGPSYVYLPTGEDDVCETGQRDPATGRCVTCPEGETWNGTACENACPSPKFVNWLGVCVDPCPAAGTDPARLNVNGGNPVCSGGCEKRATKCALRIDVGGTQTGSLKICDYVSTGNQCDWSGERPGEDEGPDVPDPEPDPQPDPCPSGQQRGQYNGQDICVKTGDTTDVKKEQTDTQETTNPDGSKTTTETRTETRIEYNSTTNTTTTTTTTTTTNTIRDSSGNVMDTNTTITVGQKQTNGNNVDAEDNAGGGGGGGGGGGEEGGGVFAGTCGVQPYCEGDAVACAIAAATFKTECALAEVRTEGETLWQQLNPQEFDQSVIDEVLNKDEAWSLDVSEMYNDAKGNYLQFTKACLPPLGFTFKGVTYSFNTAFICEVADFVRIMIHLIAYMGVLRIMQRAFGG